MTHTASIHIRETTMFTYLYWVNSLLKARGHKYIKRIPYNTPKGRRYRYIYNVTHSHRGKHAMDESHLQVGTAFMVHTESGSEVHGHIKSISGESVTYVLDDGPNKGQEITKTRSEIVSMLNEKHNVNEQVQSKRDTLKQQLQTARDNKASEKQIARIQEKLDRLGGEPAKQTISITEVIRFLEQEARTDIAGSFHNRSRNRESSSHLEFEMEPARTERQDHWFLYFDERKLDDGDYSWSDGDNSWSDWRENWATPLEEQTKRALMQKFPALADSSEWQILVGEKGDVLFRFPKNLITD